MTKSEFDKLPPDRKMEVLKDLYKVNQFITDDLTADMPDFFKDLFNNSNISRT